MGAQTKLPPMDSWRIGHWEKDSIHDERRKR